MGHGDLETIHNLIVTEFMSREADFRPDSLVLTRVEKNGSDSLDRAEVLAAWRFDGRSIQPVAPSADPALFKAASRSSEIKETPSMPLYREGWVTFWTDGAQLWVDHHYGPTKGHGAAYRLQRKEGKVQPVFLGIRWVNQGD